MEIKATSKYDWETIKEFYKFSMWGRQKALNVFVVVCCVFIGAVLLLQIVTDTFTVESIPSLAMFILLIVLLAFIYFAIPRIQYKKNKILHGIENTITFKENCFEMNQNGDNAASVGTINYNAIHKIYETKKYIYIYITPQQAHLINKDTVEGATATELRAFLFKAVGMSKYKLRCKV